MSVEHLMSKIAAVTPEGGDWCTVAKAQTLAAIVLAQRPQRIVEIGVWHGGSMIPMLMALKHLGEGVGVAIDPWATSASVVGQLGDNAAWWNVVDHNSAHDVFMERVVRHELGAHCMVMRKTSADVTEQEIAGMSPIGVCHVDGNHGPQAVEDVSRFGAHVELGGWLVIDDVHWEGGHVARAVQRAWDMGFVARYPLGTGLVMQRTRMTPTFDNGGLV